MSDTSVPLSITEVYRSCAQALDQITFARAELRNKMVWSKRGTRLYENCATDMAIWEAVPEYEKMIVYGHCVEQEKRLSLIKEMCGVASGVPGLRVNVSLDDFQLIKKFYSEPRR